jgi:hypothetical protein
MRSRPAHRRPRQRLGIMAGERLEDRRLLANTVGLILNNPAEAYGGYTLFAPSASTTTYLIDQQGNEVHRWNSTAPPMTAELMPDGTLYRAERVNTAKQWAPGQSGRIKRLDWDGNVLWSYTMATPDLMMHHDFEVLPNGNVLLIAWERKTYDQAVQAGRDPDDVPLAPGTGVRELWPDIVVEVKPNAPPPGGGPAEGGQIVWSWHLWDHVVQDRYPGRANYGSVSGNPQLVDINYYLKGDGMGGVPADWTHFNGIHYNAALDQIVVSSREFSEFWIIDHSTSTAEAATHTGGRSGRGGDLLYRYGNPAAYKSGTAADQRLFYQHDAHWIESGLPGAGNMLVFNNGWNPDPAKASFSTVVELTLPPASQQWYLNDARTSTTIGVKQFQTGVLPATTIPLAGDWDGDGKDTVGLYDPVTKRFTLFAKADGSTEAFRTFTVPSAGAGWQPITGDWNGDGKDTVGFYDPAGRAFHLSNSINNWKPRWVSSFPVITAAPVGAAARAIVGDWNGDGRDTVGLYDPATNIFRLSDALSRWGTARGVDVTVFKPNLPYLLPASWVAVAGDWNRDGKATVGLYDPAARTWYLNDRTDGSITAVTTVTTAYASASWKPLIGDWNGDGTDTFGLLNSDYAEGSYAKNGRVYGPTSPTWTYAANPPGSFYARIISGAQRLPNGNTLINEGTEGRFFEVTPSGTIVWEYKNPVIGPNAVLAQGQNPSLAGAIGIPGVYQNLAFRAYRYAATFPGFAGKTLTSRGPIERPAAQSVAAMTAPAAGGVSSPAWAAFAADLQYQSTGATKPRR